MQRGLIETLDFCELVSWGQTRNHTWNSTNINLQDENSLSNLSGYNTILTSGLQMQTLRINVAVLRPPLIRRNQRVAMTDAFDKISGRIVRADRIARARQAKALLKRRLQKEKTNLRNLLNNSGEPGQPRQSGNYTIAKEGKFSIIKKNDREYLRSSKPSPSGKSLMKLIQMVNDDVDPLGDSDDSDGADEVTLLNEENSVYSNHYDEEDEDNEYYDDDDDDESYGNQIPHQISIQSTGIHILASLMLNVINGIMASKGFSSKKKKKKK